MFKKFQDWFFKEDVDELDLDDNLLEEEEEELEPKQYEEIVERKIQMEKAVKEVTQEPKKETFERIEKPMEKARMSLDIKADGPIVKESVSREKVRVSPRRDEFEMPPVISPYFGVKEESTNSTDKVALNKISSDKKHETFNDVISPIYGIHDNEVQAETQSVLHDEELSFFHEVKKETITPAFTNFEDTTLKEDTTPYDMLEEEEENIALDEIIADTNSEEDDLIQFSLFGESKKIQDDSFENEDIDSSDDLPF